MCYTAAYHAFVQSRRDYIWRKSAYEVLYNAQATEFTFDVDVSHLPCGLNGALYLISMAKDGGASLYPNNKAGAKYGKSKTH